LNKSMRSSSGGEAAGGVGALDSGANACDSSLSPADDASVALKKSRSDSPNSVSAIESLTSSIDLAIEIARIVCV